MLSSRSWTPSPVSICISYPRCRMILNGLDYLVALCANRYHIGRVQGYWLRATQIDACAALEMACVQIKHIDASTFMLLYHLMTKRWRRALRWVAGRNSGLLPYCVASQRRIIHFPCFPFCLVAQVESGSLELSGM